jgi:hypothetical protein
MALRHLKARYTLYEKLPSSLAARVRPRSHPAWPGDASFFKGKVAGLLQRNSRAPPDSRSLSCLQPDDRRTHSGFIEERAAAPLRALMRPHMFPSEPAIIDAPGQLESSSGENFCFKISVSLPASLKEGRSPRGGAPPGTDRSDMRPREYIFPALPLRPSCKPALRASFIDPSRIAAQPAVTELEATSERRVGNRYRKGRVLAVKTLSV